MDNKETMTLPAQSPAVVVTVSQDINQMNIFEKLSAISLEITNVAKNLNVGFGSSSYKAVGEADVLAAVRPIEAKYRVYSYPVGRKIIDNGILESISSKGELKKNVYVRLEITYRFVNMDKPDEYIDIISYGDGVDPQDKSVGKAMTYGDKYALLKAYKIITGEDPDQEPSAPLNDKRGSNRGSLPKETSSAPRGTTPKVSAPRGSVPTEQPVEQPVELKVSPEIIAECKELGVTLEQIAKKKNMRVEDLTDDIIKPGLIILRNKRANKKAEEVTVAPKSENVPQGGSTTFNQQEGVQNTNQPEVPNENE